MSEKIPAKVIHDTTESEIRWALHTDLRNGKADGSYKRLEGYQNRFLTVWEHVKGPRYPWPKKPIYEWSRRAEYTYIARLLGQGNDRRLLDAGSGVTFFSYYLRQECGYDVHCLDNNDEFQSRIEQNCRLLGIDPAIPFINADLREPLPLADASYDIVMSISVVEHIEPEHRLAAVDSMWRVLSPGGLLILTVDIALNDDAEGLRRGEINELLRYFISKNNNIRIFSPTDTGTILTTLKPGCGILPLRYGGKILKPNIRTWIKSFTDAPLPNYPALGCMFFIIRKCSSL